MKSVDQRIKKYPSHIRLWHWLNAIVIGGSLITVLLNSTLFEVPENAAYIREELGNAGANVSDTQARAVSHGLEDKIWGLHIYFGYALAALFLYRITYELAGKRQNRFTSKLKIALGLYLTNKSGSTRYELGIKLLYLFFYTIFLVMVITGLLIALTKSLSHSLKEIHGFCMYLILGFIVLHIGGVFLAERKDRRGIVSDMINGGESQNL